MSEPNVGPTNLGKFVIFLFIASCLVIGGYFFRNQLFPQMAGKTDINLKDFNSGVSAEAPDTKGVTTVSEYKYIPGDKLPPVKGTSGYKWDPKNKVVQFPINVWIGWLPIVAANGGFAPNENSVFFKKYGFKVNLKLIDDPVTARDVYASGESPILWGTLDMMALFAPDLMKDSRTSPRIFQQIDWSSGGDGIVVRDGIASIKDLIGKTIVYAQNSPSQYFINNLLLNAGIQPGQVKHKFTATAFEAAAAFVSDKTIDACVSWAPDIYNIPDKVKNTRVLTTTAEANKLIADVWAVRADFAKDHPEIVEGLVAGIFDGMRLLKDETTKIDAMAKLADGYGMKLEDVKSMGADAHITNFAENKEFFLNANSAANFERSWKSITYVYKELGLIGTPARFDEVMDFSIIKKLDQTKQFADMVDENISSFTPASYSKMNAEKPIITQVIHINFYPNSANIFEPQHDESGMGIKNTLYDPNVTATLERVARLVGQFDRAVIAIYGHTDGSMKGRVPRAAVAELSRDRADGVKKALVAKYKFDPKKFVVEGRAWDEPADPQQPDNDALNRRVEIAVFSPEN